jgi:hypothetical protein
MTEDTNELLWQQDDVAPSHPEDFAYELGWVALGETLGDDDGEEAARAMGEAIVGCEEMQAIKSALRRAYWQYARQPRRCVQSIALDLDIRTRIMQRDRLPDVVVEWVLS